MYNNVKTSLKGDTGLFQVMADLNSRDIKISLPVSEHLPYDLIADKDGDLFRIQCKFTGTNKVRRANSYLVSGGRTIINTYKVTDFEYYGIYLPYIKKVIYFPNLKEATSLSIRTTLPDTYAKFYWWEDFLEIKKDRKEIPKRSIKDFGVKRKVQPQKSKVKNKPEREELKALIENKTFVAIGEMYKVSDNAVRKWAKKYELI
jgi:hypothetical protein